MIIEIVDRTFGRAKIRINNDEFSGVSNGDCLALGTGYEIIHQINVNGGVLRFQPLLSYPVEALTERLSQSS